MERKIFATCSKCGQDIYDKQTYITDYRFPGRFCSSECSNKATKDHGYSWDNYQAWKD